MSVYKKDYYELREVKDREIGDLRAQIDQIKANEYEAKTQLKRIFDEKEKLILSLTEKVGL